jgi:hypothetical protein
VNLETGVDTDSSGNTLITHCGACGLTCQANATCNDGVCACPGGSNIDLYCDEHPVTGATDNVYACTDANTAKNCGDCGNSCIDDSQCRSIRTPINSPDDYGCVCMGSDAGKTHCEGLGCRNLTEADSCGACGRECPSGVACTAGRCACPGGATFNACPVDGKPACVDLATDENNCGECGTVCGSGFQCCNSACVNINTDDANCGACGTDCNTTNFFCAFTQCCANGDCG